MLHSPTASLLKTDHRSGSVIEGEKTNVPLEATEAWAQWAAKRTPDLKPAVPSLMIAIYQTA